MLGHLLLTMALTTTDQTVNVAKGVKLDVNNFAGDVNVKVWDRDAVRVLVNHSDREVVDIKPGEQTLSVRSRSVRGGPPRSLDYAITVPKWMAISVTGTYADVTMDGVGADVTVDTARGDINITGGSGVVTLKSIQGDVTLQKAKGRIEVRAVNEGMHLADISGDLSAETTNGSIILDRIDSSNVDLYTVNGNISYDGPIKDRGVYRLTTHNGMIAVAVPERVNATLMVRTYNGSFRSTFPVKQDDQNPRKRLTVTLGNGSAHLELESFGGTIALRRPGEPRPEVERDRKRKDKDQAGASIRDAIAAAEASIPDGIAAARASIPSAIAEAQASIPEAIAEAMASLPAAIDEAMAAAHAHVYAVPNPMPRPNPRPTPRRP
jgi:Putative adhesin